MKYIIATLLIISILLIVFVGTTIRTNNYRVVNKGILENSKIGVIIDQSDSYDIGNEYSVTHVIFYGKELRKIIKEVNNGYW